MSGLSASIALILVLACAAFRPPGSAPAEALSTPWPPTLPDDAFGGIAQPGAVPVSLFIQNDGTTDDRLLGASTPVAARVELHQTRLQHGQRAMQPLADGLIIPAGKAIVLEPGAAHLMLVGLRDDLVQGHTFPLTLRFARAGDITVSVRVRRKVDAAGQPTPSPIKTGSLTISLASAPPASPAHP